MALERETIPADSVRTPAAKEGTVTIVSRYREGNAKVALVHPSDLEMLEDAYNLLDDLSIPDLLPVSDLALKAQTSEDRPDPERLVEDAEEIEAILGL